MPLTDPAPEALLKIAADWLLTLQPAPAIDSSLQESPLGL